MYPPGFQTWVDVTELGAILEGEHRPGHFRGVATVCLKLFNIVRPDVARTSARRTRSRWRSSAAWSRDLEPRRSSSASCRPCATPTASRSRRATRCLSPEERDARARAPARARDARRARPRARPLDARRPRGRLRRGRRLRPAPSSPPPSASARPVSSTTSSSKETAVSIRPHTRTRHAGPGKLPLTELAEMKARAAADRDGHRVRRARRRASPTRPASTSCSSATPPR